MIKRMISIPLMLTIFFSCSQVRLSKKSSGEAKVADKAHLSEDEIRALNQKTLARVSARLNELSIAAKASGPDKVRFLASDMYLKASAALMEGDFQTANLLFENFVKLVPSDSYVQKKYAISLLRAGELTKAEGILAELYKGSKFKDDKVGLVLAGVYANLKKTGKSRKIYSTLIKRNPKNEEACIFLGKSYALEKKTKTAVRLLQRCEKADKGKGIYSYYIGKIYVDKKDFKAARKYFKRSIKREPGYTQGVMALGLIYEELGQKDLARVTYIKYLETKENDILILNRLVQMMFAQEKYNEVIPFAKRLAALEPDNLNLKVKLGILYTDIKNYSEAIAMFKGLLRFAPKNDKILYYLGAIYQEKSEYENAISAFGQISDESGLYQDSSLQIAHMLSKLARSGGSKKEERFLSYIDGKLQTLKGFEVDLSVIKASYFESIGSDEEAIAALEFGKENKKFLNEHKFYLASLYEKEKRFKESTSLIEGIIELEPKNAHAWNFLGYSILERGESLDLAYEYIRKAVSLSPNDGYIRDSLGWYYFKNGESKKAIKELKVAAKLVKGDISVTRHLAVVYTKLKNYKLARKYTREALAKAEEQSDKDELIEALKELESDRVPASFK